MGRHKGTLRGIKAHEPGAGSRAALNWRTRARPAYVSQGAQSWLNSRSAMVSDPVRMTDTVVRREHDFEHARYVIDWDDCEQNEISPNEDSALEERL
jgi:hypothetical protein